MYITENSLVRQDYLIFNNIFTRANILSRKINSIFKITIKYPLYMYILSLLLYHTINQELAIMVFERQFSCMDINV